jgi:hypothetical protein
MTAASKIRQHIFLIEEGKLFSPRHFLHYGSRATVDKNLHELEKRQIIRRVTRGIYMRETASGWRPNAEQVAYAKAWFFCRDILRCPNSFEGCSSDPGTITFLTTRGTTSFYYDGKRIDFKAVGFRKFQSLQDKFAGFSDLHAKHHDITADYDPDLLKRHLAEKRESIDQMQNENYEILSFDPFAQLDENHISPASAESASIVGQDFCTREGEMGSNLVSMFPRWLRSTFSRLRQKKRNNASPHLSKGSPMQTEKNSADDDSLNFDPPKQVDLELVTGNVYRLPEKSEASVDSLGRSEEATSTNSGESPNSEQCKKVEKNEVVHLFSSFIKRLPEKN